QRGRRGGRARLRRYWPDPFFVYAGGMFEVGASIPVLPGELLAGKYRVERLLGQGGMGTVVAARHLLLEQPVAIKFLRGERADDPTIAERLRREAKAAAKITGDHLVPIFHL